MWMTRWDPLAMIAGPRDEHGPLDRADPGSEEAAAHLRYVSDVMEVVEPWPDPAP